MKFMSLAIVFAVVFEVNGKPQKHDETGLIDDDPNQPNLADYGLDEGAQDDPNQTDYEGDYGADDEDPEEVNNEDDILPRILTEPKEILSKPGQNVVFPCEIKDLGSYVRVWNKNNGTLNVLYQGSISLAKSDNVFLTDDQSLHISNVSQEDVGNYTCEILISNGNSIDVTHTLKLPTNPTIVSLSAENHKSVYVKGETLRLTCKATGTPQPVISWHKDTRLDVKGETLTIDNLRAKDGGLYRCLADNGNREPAHASIQIDVESEPIVTIDKYIVNTDSNMDIELKCTVHGSPMPSTIWQKGGVNIVNSDHYTLKNKGKHHILLIKDVQESDFAQYTCSAKNGWGKVEKNITITKKPAVLPHVKSEKVGKDFLLTFKVESKSPISEHDLQYRKKGEPEWKQVKPEVTNADNDNVYTVKYTLQNLESGAYEARVRSHNSHGWSEFSDVKEFLAAKNHNNKHKQKHHKEKEVKEHEQDTPPAQQEIHHKESPVGASQTSATSTVSSSIILTCIALLSLLCCRN